jgi:hypothetical protein
VRLDKGNIYLVAWEVNRLQTSTVASHVTEIFCMAFLTFCRQGEAAAHQQRREESAAARLAALKTDDLSAYLALLQQNKNGRLQEVLAETDAVFKQLSAHLGVFDQPTTSAGTGQMLM